jgi:hypothetical protein
MKIGEMMTKRLILISGLIFLVAGMFLWGTAPAAASPNAQAYYQTPTPDADGRILYTVQAGDSCLSISLLTGVDLNELRILNNLDGDCIVQEGQQLLLGVVDMTVQQTPTPTPTPSGPTPTPFSGTGSICVYLFADINGNALAEETEGGIAGGAVSVSDRLGEISLTGTTSASIEEKVCFEEIPEGEYNISVAPPEGYNATTNMNYPIKLKAGDQFVVDFGAQLSSQGSVQQEQVPQTEGPTANRSPLLAIVGVVLIVGGILLGLYFRQMRR